MCSQLSPIVGVQPLTPSRSALKYVSYVPEVLDALWRSMRRTREGLANRTAKSHGIANERVFRDDHHDNLYLGSNLKAIS